MKAATSENGYHPILTARMLIGMIITAILLALAVKHAYAPFNACPEGTCTTIHFPGNGCKIWSEADDEKIRELFHRRYTEFEATRHELVMSKNGLGCVEAVRIFYKPLPPVMDSITHPVR